MHKLLTTLWPFNMPEDTLEVIHFCPPPAHLRRTHPASHVDLPALVACDSVVQSVS